MKKLHPVYFSIVFILVLFAYGYFNGFGAQCERAGYTGAQHEACVMRRAEGGPVYEENIGK